MDKNLPNLVEDVKYLEEILNKQKKLIKKFKIDNLLENIFKPLKIIEKPNIYYRCLNLDFFEILFLIKFWCKMLIKNTFNKNKKIIEFKKEKLSSKDIKNFMIQKYNIKNSQTLCIFTPK